MATPQITIPIPIFADIVIPSFQLPLAPTLPLVGQTTVFDGAITSPPLPLGDLFGFDYGSLLFGFPLTFGGLVQNQFETGATMVNVSGGVGPFDGTYSYNGVLQPGNEQILADYTLNITGPGYLSDLEAWALGLINDNADVFAGFAYDLFIASDPCTSDLLPVTVPGALLNTCRSIFEQIDPSGLTLQLTSLGTVSGAFAGHKSITPVPLPAALPLLAGGIAIFGLMGLGRRRRAA